MGNEKGREERREVWQRKEGEKEERGGRKVRRNEKGREEGREVRQRKEGEKEKRGREKGPEDHPQASESQLS